MTIPGLESAPRHSKLGTNHTTLRPNRPYLPGQTGTHLVNASAALGLLFADFGSNWRRLRLRHVRR